ncbi:MAG: radical SAM protein [Candidatus Omnitrophica bacterium]|nr:radical SAM protein [Candidatus Omnitrophota bacterium]
MNILFIDFDIIPHFAPNMGIAYIISAVEKRHKVKLLTPCFYGWRRKSIKYWCNFIKDQIKKDKPDIIAFSLTSYSVELYLQTSRLIKAIYPDIRFIIGGFYPTLFPDKAIELPLVDAICIGEGEASMVEYLEQLQNSQTGCVDGIWYKDKGNKIIKNRLRQFNDNLDGLPFLNWQHWAPDIQLKYKWAGMLPFMLSRGCIYNCTFCCSPAIKSTFEGNYYRLRSPENVIEEIKVNKDRYSSKGFRSIFFLDPLFGFNWEQLDRFCDLYIKEGFHKSLPWFCSGRADIINEKWAKRVSQAGCRCVSIGIESGDDFIRNTVYKKNLDRRQIEAAVSHLKGNDILVRCTFIAGCYQDNKETIQQSMDLYKKLRPSAMAMLGYEPIPGSESWRDSGIAETTISCHKCFKPILKTRELGIKDLNKTIKKIKLQVNIDIIKDGLRQKGVVFIWDTLRYLFTPLKNNLWLATIFRYHSKAYSSYEHR